MKSRDNFGIATVEQLIERLQQNTNVVGILQYGSGVCPDAADTDICVVVSKRPEGIESIHFWIGSGPVDLNIRTLDELARGGVADLPGLDDVLREGKVLYNSEPGLLDGLSPSLAGARCVQEPHSIPFMRHGHAHVINKLVYYKGRDPLLCDILLCGAVHWLLGAYVIARGLPYRGEKAALKVIRDNDRDLLTKFENLTCGKLPIVERIEILRRLTDEVLAPIGGPWQRTEVLFFPDSSKTPQRSDQWQEFFASLMRTS